MLSRLRFEFAGRADKGYQRYMEEKHVLASNVTAYLACRFHKGQRFNIAYRTADFGDDDIGRVFDFGGVTHTCFDFISDMRNNLHGIAQIFSATFFCDNGRVHLTGCNVSGLVKVLIKKAFVMPNIKVCFSTIVSYKDFAVLERVHGTGVYVKVRVKFLHRDR